MQAIFFLCLVMGSLVTLGVGRVKNCDHLGVLLYEDLGCKPIRFIHDPCPYRYNCHLIPRQNKSCTLRGKNYNVGEVIDDSLITENCFFDCKCADRTNLHRYECGIFNCTEWTQRYNVSTCYKTYDINQCCSTGIKCPMEELKIHQCALDNMNYREGELFVPKNRCYKCACKPGFRGLMELPFCKRNLCGTQIVNTLELENSCAPLYLPSVTPAGEENTALCCPEDWVCHSKIDKVIRISPSRHPGLGIVCNFGPLKLDFGEGLRKMFNYFGMDFEVTCECIIPPLLTCKKSLV